jgi:hypothetical protein
MGQIQICSSHAQSGYQLLGIHLMQKIQSTNEIRRQKLKTERVAASCAECIAIKTELSASKESLQLSDYCMHNST